jgi:hypothetical protein
MRHYWVKIFGGTYIKNKGKKNEEQYWYKGSIPSWIEARRYNKKRNKLIKKSKKLQSEFKMLRETQENLIKRSKALSVEMDEFNG